MAKKTLVLFENERVCPQALAYAREFSMRMDLEVAFLMIVAMPWREKPSLGFKRRAFRRLEKRTGNQMTGLTADFLSHGVAVSVALRVGDPAEELLRYLAERPPFETIIWGSDEQLPGRGPGGKPHWIFQVTRVLECPVFSVHTRTKTETTDMSETK